MYKRIFFTLILGLFGWTFLLGQQRAPQEFVVGAKTTTVNPILMGSSHDAYWNMSTAANQVFASNALNAVGFVHRNNSSATGGTNGSLRYDISIDGGLSFSSDIGPMNTLVYYPARYPNAVFSNPVGNSDPLNASLVMVAPIYGNSFPYSWLGHWNGVSALATSGSPLATDHYDSDGKSPQTGLCEVAPGQFMAAEVYNSYAIRLMCGTQTTTDCNWTFCGQITPDLNNFSGELLGPNLAFSPDGTVGWLAFLGDMLGGADTVLSPILCKTTDGGANWSVPVEVNLNGPAWVKDSLQSLWVDLSGDPLSSGKATCSHEFDLTVDANGNPHIAVVVGSHISGQYYTLAGGLAKFMADIHSTDGGTTWEIAYISPVLTYKSHNYGSGPSLFMYNSPQIARSEDGQFIFYAWADSDTSLVTGSQAGIGFGNPTNLAPNLRISAMNIGTTEQVYPKLITDGDLIWEGRGTFPSMAPVVLNSGQGCFKLPIVIIGFLGGAESPVEYQYFGNDAVICASDFCLPTSMELGWTSFAYAGATPPCLVGVEPIMEQQITLADAYPNPSDGVVAIGFELPESSEIRLEIRDVYGKMVATIAEGDFAAGPHQVVVNTSSLANGIYYYSLRAGDQVLTKKLFVLK
jgi:hypothetical protein